jgi:uncharacterized membrane protein (DUF373 family)
MPTEQEDVARHWLSRGFGWVEDVVYLGLGVVLAGCAVALLASAAIAFWNHILAGTLSENIIDLLDGLLLILLIIEVMYTVQVSFRSHTLAPEPFVMVGLIAVVRRLLVLTAEVPQLLEQNNPELFRQISIELALLAVLIISLVASMVLLRRHPVGAVAKRA